MTAGAMTDAANRRAAGLLALLDSAREKLTPAEYATVLWRLRCELMRETERLRNLEETRPCPACQAPSVAATTTTRRCA